jgi:hypothetical protein
VLHLNFVYDVNLPLSSVPMAKTHFLTLIICFLTFNHYCMCSQRLLLANPTDLSSCENCAGCDFKTRHSDKGWSITQENCHFFLDTNFSCKLDDRPTFNFNMKKVGFPIYRVMSRMLGFLGIIADLKPS